MKYYLAIDLGATSGRHIVAYKKDNEIVLDETHRFITGMDDSNNGKVWNIPRLFDEIKIGIRKSFEKYSRIESLAIDCWGVDYVLLNGDEDITPYYAYRNTRTDKSIDYVHNKIPFDQLYSKTGIQFASFNTIYQLCDDLLNNKLDMASDFLMLPSYFTYKLTGKKINEYTNLSTGALLDANKKDYAFDIIDKLNLPRKIFKEFMFPGAVVGELKDDIAKEVGGNLKVVLAPSHDTACAFEALQTKDSIIISSGTWSLLGVKLEQPLINEESIKYNYTNEGGVNYIRFLKNIMGMWVSNKVNEELMYSHEYINEGVRHSTYEEWFDINDSSLLSPVSMRESVMKLLSHNPPKNDLDLFKAIYNSLAHSYKIAIDELEKITNKTYKTIYIIGGGAKNQFINETVAKLTNKEVIALAIEATALGNIITQMKVEE